MARFLHHSDSCTLRKWSARLLAFSWILGLGCGGLVFRFAGESIVSLMPIAVSGPVSIVGLLTCTLLPFLFTAFAVYVSLPWLLIVVSFCKSFLYAYVSCAVLTAFGSAGWLVRALLLFSDTCGAVLLYSCWLWYLDRGRRSSVFGVCAYSIAAAAAALMDGLYIAPLLQSAVL